MLTFALLIVLIVEVICITVYDKKIFGNYFSPAVVLSYPLLIIVIFAMLAGGAMGFKSVHSSLLLLSIAGVAIFWAGSFFWSFIIPSHILKKMATNFSEPAQHISLPLKKGLQALACLVILFMLFSFYNTIRMYGSISSIGTDEFTYNYGGSGIAGHVLGLAIPLLIYFIGIVKKTDRFTLLLIAGLVALALLYQVKTWLFVPLIGGMMLRYFNKRKIALKPGTIILAVLAVMLLFGLTYAFSVRAEGYSFFQKLGLLLKHFMSYVFAGVIGFGEHIKQGLPLGSHPEELFRPFINLYNVITGNPVSGVVSPYHVSIDIRGLDDVNVKTFFGTILINGGYFFGILYTLILSIILYFIWIIASITKNYWFVVLYVFFAAALVLGWFDFYYNQLPFLELPVYIAIMVFITKKKQIAR